MTGFKKALAVFEAKKFHKKVELGDKNTYDIKGVGSTNLQLDSGTLMTVGEILYVTCLKKNVISMTVLEDKGFSVAFSKAKALIWPKGGSMSLAIVIRVREGDLFNVSRHVLHSCQDSEIKRETTVLSSPQQNGVKEKEIIDVISHHS